MATNHHLLIFLITIYLKKLIDESQADNLLHVWVALGREQTVVIDTVTNMQSPMPKRSLIFKDGHFWEMTFNKSAKNWQLVNPIGQLLSQRFPAGPKRVKIASVKIDFLYLADDGLIHQWNGHQ